MRRRVRPLPPTGIQLGYYAELKKMLAFARALVERRLLARLPELLERAAALRGDHLDAQPPGKRVNRLIDRISESFYRAYPQERLEQLSEKIARSTSAHQKEQLFRQVKSVVGVALPVDRGLTPRVKQFVAENVALIKSVPQTYFDDVEKTVLAGMRAGTRHENIALDLEERLGVAESSAKLIARDQVLKFTGELNAVRQQALGVDSYTWRTVNDERVRDRHADLDGEVFRWDDPPIINDRGERGHPGQDIQCRCYSEPNLEELLADLESSP